jgi:O-antigen ligase
MIPITRNKLLLQDYSGQVRLSQWSETVAFLKDNLFFGAGLNGYPEALTQYHNPTLYEIFQYPHNIFLNTWVELGVLGLIALIWFSHLIFSSILRRRPKDLPELIRLSAKGRHLQLALFAALLTIFIHGLVDVPYFKNDLSLLTWTLLAGFSVTSSRFQRDTTKGK